MKTKGKELQFRITYLQVSEIPQEKQRWEELELWHEITNKTVEESNSSSSQVNQTLSCLNISKLQLTESYILIQSSTSWLRVFNLQKEHRFKIRTDNCKKLRNEDTCKIGDNYKSLLQRDHR